MGIICRNTYDPEVSPLLSCTPEVIQYNRSYLKQLDVTRTFVVTEEFESLKRDKSLWKYEELYRRVLRQNVCYLKLLE